MASIRHLVLFIFLFPVTSIFSQEICIEKYIGNPVHNTIGNAVLQSDNGSLYVLSTSDEGYLGGNDIRISKLQADGSIIWEKYFGTSGNDFGLYMDQAADQSLIICGSIEIPGPALQAYIMKVDQAGNEIFFETIPHNSMSAEFYHIEALENSGFIASGVQADTVSGHTGGNAFLVRFDENGQIIWQRNYGGSQSDYTHCVRATEDGGFIVSGDSKSFSNGDYDNWLVKTDSMGNPEWQLTIGDTLTNGNQSVLITSENQYLLVGEAQATPQDGFDINLSKVSNDGQLIWDKKIGDNRPADAAFSVIQQEDQYILTGYSNGFDHNQPTDMVMLHLDTAGNELSREYYGNAEVDIGYDIKPSIYNGFLAVGFSNSPQQGSQALLIHCYDSSLVAINEIGEELLNVQVAPNPFSDQAKISNPDGHLLSYEVCDLSGRVLLSGQSRKRVITLEMSLVPNAMYFLRLTGIHHEQVYFKLVRSGGK